jgi:invasion protein IalB
MRQTFSLLALAAALAALPVAAQETQAPADGAAAGGEAAPAAPVLPMGQPVAPDGGALGTPYVKEEHGDWDIRCIRTESGNDPCQLYQLLEDAQNNPVAEFAIFPLMPAQGEAVAGGTIISPLETLLTEGVTLGVDGGEARRYPFTFCSSTGCVARLGYAAADIDRFKQGAKANVVVVPVVAPDQRIALEVSLSGFTAGYDAVVALMEAQAEAARAEQGSAEGGADAPAKANN